MQTSLNIKVKPAQIQTVCQIVSVHRNYNLNGRLCHELFKLKLNFVILSSSLSLLNEFSIGKAGKAVKPKLI